MKIFYLVPFLLLFLAGCSSNLMNYTEFVDNQDYYNKNINVFGEVKLYQDGFYYIVDNENVKIKLIECYDKYNLVLGENVEVNGYLTKDGNKISLTCKSYDTTIQNLTSQVDELNKQISTYKSELQNIKNQKQSQISSLDKQISSKNTLLSDLTFKLDNATKEKEIIDVKDEILDRAKNFPNTPKVEEFQKWILLGMEPYKTDPIKQGYRDWFYKISSVNKNYTITIYADRNVNTDYYKSYNLIIEKIDEKYTCTKTN